MKLNKDLNTMAAVLIKLRDMVTHKHESKKAFIARMRAILENICEQGKNDY